MKNYIKNLIDIALIELTKVVMIFSLTIILSGLLYYQLSYSKLFLSIVIIYIILRIITYNMRFFLYGSITIIGLVLSTIIIMLTTDYLSQVAVRFNQYIYVYKTALSKGYLIPLAYQLVIGIVIGFVICCFVLIIERYKHALILHVLMGITIILIAYFIRGYYNQVAYYIYISGMVIYYYYQYYLGKIKVKHNTQFYPLAIHALLFAVVLVFISGYSYKKSPRPLQFINEISKTIDKYIINGKSGSRKGGGGTGLLDGKEEAVTVRYDSTEELKATVELTDHAILNVYTDNPMYLRGSICNIFDGKEWSYDKKSNYEINDFQEHIYGLQWLTTKLSGDSDEMTEESLRQKYFRKNDVNIIYRNIATETLFLPNNVVTIIDTEGDYANNAFAYNAGGIATFESDLTEGFSYSIVYYKPKYNENVLEDVLRESQNGYYKSMPSTTYKADLVSKALDIRKNYMQIPKSTTNRTLDLAKEITKDSTSDYDRAKAIEAYLKSKYDYTYTTELPEQGDPIDYFLFETKEGFCTYNATAMVLMLRINHIPARFVKGFVVKGAQEEEEITANNEMMQTKIPDTNLNVVTGWDSHAWVEAYFEGYGWIAFEPTSGFEMLTASEDVPIPVVEIPEDTELNEVYDLEGIALSQKRIPVFYIVILLIILVLFVVSMVLLLRWKLNEQKFKNGQNRFVYMALFHKCLLMIRLAGYSKDSHQTMREFAKNIAGEMDTDHMNFITYVTRYEISCYSSKPVPDDWIKEIEDYYKYVKHLAKSKTNFWHVQSALFIFHIK